ncbi:4362_t:CDS:10 [Funneliformis mosseae]|uniref:4362_t:CDS:1 n=2 Tax=Funneliformis TaxID=1117308 RepID=A0A9N9F8V2_FUNMO|nr:4362_t:CDS:10 [Funneliformis mosseae]
MSRQNPDFRRGNRGRGRSNNDRRNAGRRAPPAPLLSIPAIQVAQQEATIENFRSSELTCHGSDRLIVITNGDPIKTIWKKIIRKEFRTLNQGDIRIFISSALVVTNYRHSHEIEDFIKTFGNPDGGVKKLREIITIPSMSCDAGLRDDVLSFQHVILPLLGLLTRTSITECFLETYIHAIFMVVYINLDSFLYNNVIKMLETLVQRNSVADNQISVEDLLRRDRYAFIPSSIGIFFLIIVRLLTVLLRRIKEASINVTMHKIARDLQNLKTLYQQNFQLQQPLTISTDPLMNNLESRKYFFMVLENEMNTMIRLLNNGRVSLIDEQNPNKKELISKLTSLRYKSIARRADLERSYDPPGELSKNGKRHDNDFEEISEISIIPTIEEILCDRRPFLPFSHPDAPHFLPNGAAKLLDTHFRLLREDLLNPIRGSISNLINVLSQDLRPSLNNNEFSKEIRRIQKEYGGLHVYTNIQFVGVTCDRKKGFAYTLRFTPPKNRYTNSERDRIAYWEKSKRLLNGSLITLLLPNPDAGRNHDEFDNDETSKRNSDKYLVFFGVVASRNERNLAKHADYADICINFTDLLIYPIALSEISNPQTVTDRTLEQRFMVESTGVYFEAYYHILKTLQSTNPSSLPFEKYFAPNIDDLHESINFEVEPPMYTRAPGFEFDLSILCDKQQTLKLNVGDTGSYDEVAKKVNEYSKLDETQAKALISALTREIALIEGPPGTGKTVVGVEIMKVLLAEQNRKTNIGPILTICFTNHALDQFLEHLLDINIKNIVRLGSRTKSERIKELSIEMMWQPNSYGKDGYELRNSLKEIEKRVNELNNTLSNNRLKWKDVSGYLKSNEKKFYVKFDRVNNYELPSWVLGTYSDEEEFLNEYKVVHNNRSANLPIFEKWLKGIDIDMIYARKNILLNPKQMNGKKKKRPTNNKYVFLEDDDSETDSSDDESQTDHEMIQWILDYEEPETDRPLELLLNINSIWKMSRMERITLHDYWRIKVNQESKEILSRLQTMYDRIRNEWSEIYDEGRRQTLSSCDVIGMTTNGAAKFQNLIQSIKPKIIICEEAGEVLEAHILSALTPLTQHLILIGDPNQLRPHVATYSLSMDSNQGKNYQLDKSLFERLVNGDNSSKIDKVQLLTQRRMREIEISDLIRNTLYEGLKDGENTSKYEKVRGAQHNVYFINHDHPEDNSDGEFATLSHVNNYEVRMVVEMVKYFIKNGYTKSDDIAVLTPYLGQMMRIKDALSRLFVVVLDERDSQDLAEMEEEQEVVNNSNEDTSVSISEKSLYQQVTLRTVDNFQGEEATIVIVSLVRNFSNSDRYDTIGFLKSTNRSNVLLSRAREGMYLIGNSKLMATRSEKMWTPVIDMLQARNPPQVGYGMPIACHKHPEYKHVIENPEDFDRISPDGGCNQPCRAKLPCGHVCISLCHSDDPYHLKTKCKEPCPKLHSVCNHPCPKYCFDDCGICNFPMGDIILPGCGHTWKNAKCWENQKKDEIKCLTPVQIQLPSCGHSKTICCHESVDDVKCFIRVEKQLPSCEHSKTIFCHESVDTVKCNDICGKMLNCNHECSNRCHVCQDLSKPRDIRKIKDVMNCGIVPIERTKHAECKNLCNKSLFCGHKCVKQCHEGSACSPCGAKCTISCDHLSCDKRCIEPCSVCAETCPWECEHQGRCRLNCGVPCFRLPCNKKCNKRLECGHMCAGVCGEVCPSKDFCITCAPESVKSQVPDAIVKTLFCDVDWDGKRMIVLSCGHAYTMETMDMHMGMEDYYEGSIKSGWTSVKILPASLSNVKTCPECRTPIKNIRRYGRIVNKCILDAQNKKFLTKYVNQLNNVTKRIIFFEDNMKDNQRLLQGLGYLPADNSRVKENVFGEHQLPDVIPCKYFKFVDKFHGFDRISKKIWMDRVGELLKYYQELISIVRATKSPPHKKAFDASTSTLYQAKFSMVDPESDLNVRLSNLKISDDDDDSSKNLLSQKGISISKVDRRIYLDTLFEMVNLQKVLFNEILFIIQKIMKAERPIATRVEEVWKKFGERLLLTIEKHLNTIQVVAKSTRYGRHLLLVNVEILELGHYKHMYQSKYSPNRFAFDNIPQTRIMTGRIHNIFPNFSTYNIIANGKLESHLDNRLRDLIKEVESYDNDLNETTLTLQESVSIRDECYDLKPNKSDTIQETNIEGKLEIHRVIKTEFKNSAWNECPNGHPSHISEPKLSINIPLKEYINQKKEQLAEISQRIVEDPENNVIGQLKDLREIVTDKNLTVKKLAILSQFVVYKDIIPGIGYDN